MRNIMCRYGVIMAVLMLFLATIGSTVWAQADTPDQKRAGVQDQDRDRDRDNWRDQLHKRVDAAPDLTPDERAEMHANLDACVNLGVSEVSLQAIFPGDEKRYRVSTQAMLRLQNRVRRAAHEGLVVEPMLAKVNEGLTKGVPEPRVEQACDQMEKQVRSAHRIMERAMNDGFEPPGDPAQNRRMETEMAQQMWRGMNEEGYEQIREQARVRLRNGECGVGDLVSAGEVATRLTEAGVERERALRFSGEALKQGYRVQEMRQIQVMLASQRRQGEPANEFMGDMEHCIGAGMGAGEMYNYMLRHGWMGPGDMYGPGGHQPADHKGHGGGQQGDGGHHGGNGGTGGGNGQGGK